MIAKKILGKYSLTVKVVPLVLLIIGLKLAAHWCGYEILSLNPLFSGLVAANVFLMGFLISGVLTDYKESEKLPGEMAGSLESLLDEVGILAKSDKPSRANECLVHLRGLSAAVLSWFSKQEKTRDLFDRLSALNDFFYSFEPIAQANFIARMKQEQGNIRRLIIRVHTIRETSFVSSGYAIAEITTVLLCCGLILSKIDPFYESLFFVGLISFLLIFMLMLIKDLDNPFGYYEDGYSDPVSLHPLEDLLRRVGNR